MKIVFYIFLILLTSLNSVFSDDNFPDSVQKQLKNKSPNEQIEILSNLCWNNRFINQIDAFRYGQSALNIANSINNKNAQAKLYNYLGVIYLHQGAYPNANEYFLKAKKNAEEINNADEFGYALNNLGNISLYRHDFNDALNLIKESINYHKKADNLSGVAYSYLRLSEVFNGQNMFDSSLYYADLSLEIRNKFNDKILISKSKLARADALVGLCRYDEAIDIFNEIRNIIPETIRVYMQLGEAYSGKKDFKLASEYFNFAFEQAKKNNNNQLLFEICELLSINSYKQGNFERAYYYAKQLNGFRDSLFNENNVKQMKFLQFTSNTEEQTRKLAEFEKSSYRNKILILSIGIVILILGFILFWLLYNKKKQKENYILLESKNEEILLQSNRLDSLNKTKDKFFSIIAHDLRNPLGSFKQITEYISSNYEELSFEDQLEFINTMKNSANNIFGLLENLLDWSRSQSDSLKFNPSSFNLFFLVNDIITNHSHIAQSKNIALNNKIPIDLIVETDQNMLNTILRNLISNSIKFSNENSQIIISSKIKQNKVIVSIQDFGIGIPAEDINNIFVLTANKSTLGTQNEKGTGLGLILCKELMIKMSEDIWVNSEIGKGTIFSFTLSQENK